MGTCYLRAVSALRPTLTTYVIASGEKGVNWQPRVRVLELGWISSGLAIDEIRVQRDVGKWNLSAPLIISEESYDLIISLQLLNLLARPLASL